MRVILTAILVFSLTLAAPFAGCGKKENIAGALGAVDQAAKTVSLTKANGETVTFKVKANTKFLDASGNATTADVLNGKQVDTSSEHKVLETARAKS